MERIVVGVDGSEHGGAALRWAIEEADRHGASVTGVMVWSYLDQHRPEGGPAFDPGYDDARARAELSAAVHAVAGGHPVEERLVNDLPAAGLLEAAEGADLLVVGARGRGGFAGLLLGSVSEGVLERSRCPVAVIRGGIRPADAPVVVGIDGSPSSPGALHWAADEARARRAPLVLVHAIRMPFYTPPSSEEVVTSLEDAAREIVDTAVADPALEGLEVRVHTPAAGAAQAVMAAAADASLIVAGSRAHSRFERMLLGSTSRQLAHHSPCPIVVVPIGR